MMPKLIYHTSDSISPWREEKKNEVMKIYAEILSSPTTQELLNKLKEHYFPAYMHGTSVCERLVQYGVFQKFSKEKIVELATAGLLLDIGYIKIPVYYLNKRGLSAEEFKEIKQHPRYGAELLKEAGLSEKIQTYVLDHHESPNGNGYLNKKKLADLMDGQLEIHIADVYEAVQEKRAYRSGRDELEAYEMIVNMSECLQEIEVLEYMRIAKMLFA